jgi:lysyl-tRNA synthetase class 2
MTDSIKHFTGFDISGKMKPVFEAARGMGLTWIKPWGKEN